MYLETGGIKTYVIYHYDDMCGVISFSGVDGSVYVGRTVDVKGHLFICGVWWEKGKYREFVWYAKKQAKQK